MKTNTSPKGSWESATGSGGATSLSHSTSLALALLLISAIPPYTGAPVFLDLSTTDNDKLLNQIDNACASFLPEEQPLRTLDTLLDLCDRMQDMLPKYQELETRETTKRFLFHYTKPNTGLPDGTSVVFHPLLQLIPELHNRRRRRITSHEICVCDRLCNSPPGHNRNRVQEFCLRSISGAKCEENPRIIQSRGYFLYRPRNGRRSTEYL